MQTIQEEKGVAPLTQRHPFRYHPGVILPPASFGGSRRHTGSLLQTTPRCRASSLSFEFRSEKYRPEPEKLSLSERPLSSGPHYPLVFSMGPAIFDSFFPRRIQLSFGKIGKKKNRLLQNTRYVRSRSESEGALLWQRSRRWGWGVREGGARLLIGWGRVT
ncbi:hypothetical protein CEXT_473621 [Caerostris extrusa]|uniref:Uncharacterized protein n=1 Tax=Caerostris extrusa TaxID=172846 RepID=A0AAV4RMY4_CAEEX|nr:hypothetical protein CEXT_473621 [Caerostris extrusa]